MSYTTDPTTDIGRVRLLIQDTDPFNPIYPDDNQISAFLELEGGDIKFSAALALESIAANMAFVLRVIKILDLQTDGQKTAQSFLDIAKRYRDLTGVSDWAGFDIAQVTDDSTFALRDYLWKQLRKEELGGGF